MTICQSADACERHAWHVAELACVAWVVTFLEVIVWAGEPFSVWRSGICILTSVSAVMLTADAALSKTRSDILHEQEQRL